MANATNTDPVLFRVILAVLSFFGGIGILAYLLAWLLIPAEGEAASPLGSLLGRGRSGTATVVTVLLIAGVAVVVPWSPLWFPIGSFDSTLLLIVAGVLGLYFLIRRRQSSAAGPPTVAAAAAAPPFAPHGPYSTASGSTGETVTMSTAEPPPTTSAAAIPPAVPVEPPPTGLRAIRLSLLSFGAMCVALAALLTTDLLWADLPIAAYFAVPAGIAGVGLIVGTWLGKARTLIPLALILLLGLGSTVAVAKFDDDTIVWRPTTVEQLQGSYTAGGSNATLDLRALKTETLDRTREIRIRLGAGDLRVLLPTGTPATVDARIGVGSLRMFGDNSDGIAIDKEYTDSGASGKTHLSLDVQVGAGSVKVTR